MTKGQYFTALKLHCPAKYKAGIAKWRREHTEQVRVATRKRVARFRARRK